MAQPQVPVRDLGAWGPPHLLSRPQLALLSELPAHECIHHLNENPPDRVEGLCLQGLLSRTGSCHVCGERGEGVKVKQELLKRPRMTGGLIVGVTLKPMSILTWEEPAHSL